MEYQISRYSNLLVEVATDLPVPTPTEIPKSSPSPIELIGLLFTLRRRRSRFHVSENGDRRLVWQEEGLRIPLCENVFRSEIFNRGDDSLFRSLACSLENFERGIDAESVAEAVMERWGEIREEVNSRSSDRVFTMTVNLTVWSVEARHEIGFGRGGGENCRMIPACSEAMEKMLKRIEIENDGGVCAICLEELKKKKNGVRGLQMPCLHVFHGSCIQGWLKNSHYCPVCRFKMPVPQLN